MEVWIVEIRVNGRWKPTVGCSLSRETGRLDLKEWQRDNPSDSFRLVRYASMDPRGEAARG